MWYEDKNKPKELDYSKPIVYEESKDDLSLLLPQICKDSYEVIGYNWFNAKSGSYESACLFKTAKDAVDSRISNRIFNVDIKLTKIKD